MEKKVISLLTKILASHGALKVKAETFRLSKLNKSEAVIPMLGLLFDVIHIYKFGKPHVAHCCCNLRFQASNTLDYDPHCALDFVQRELFNLGYKSCDLFSIHEDLSSGSRELLLAFSWFISKIDFIGILLRKYFCNTAEQFNIDKKSDINDKSVSKLSISDQLKYLVMINNKIRMTSRLVQALQQECNLSAHRLHEETQGQSVQPNMNHLTLREVKMLRCDPKKLSKQLQTDNNRLQELLQWREQEDVFWDWMKTVLALKIIPEQSTNSNHSSDLTYKDCQFLVEAKTNLEKALLPYNNIISDLDKIWMEKKLQMCEKDLNEIAKEIDLEIDLFHKKHNIPHKLHISQSEHSYYLVSDTGSQTSNSKQFTKKHLDESVTLINDQINHLEHLIYELDDKILTKQESYQKQIDEVAAKFKEFACIPVSPL
ncbi:tubulin epsilon and delta complex protein 1-like [Argonauta hians]